MHPAFASIHASWLGLLDRLGLWPFRFAMMERRPWFCERGQDRSPNLEGSRKNFWVRCVRFPARVPRHFLDMTTIPRAQKRTGTLKKLAKASCKTLRPG